jgi:hypothetical protein
MGVWLIWGASFMFPSSKTVEVYELRGYVWEGIQSGRSLWHRSSSWVRLFFLIYRLVGQLFEISWWALQPPFPSFFIEIYLLVRSMSASPSSICRLASRLLPRKHYFFLMFYFSWMAEGFFASKRRLWVFDIFSLEYYKAKTPSYFISRNVGVYQTNLILMILTNISNKWL